MRIVYSISIYLYHFAVMLFSLWDSKAKQWLNGRRKWTKSLAGFNPDKKRVFWFHCASLGEFEQGRPVIEAIKNEHPEVFVLLTFFSPSGYEIRKNYDRADFICYLPDDTTRNAKKFLELTNPSIAVFIKYEFWFNYIHQLKRRKVPVYSASAIFRKDQLFFRWYGGWFRKHLAYFESFFVQNQDSKNILIESGIKQAVVSGDTRYDRVSQIAESGNRFPLLERFSSGKIVIIGGSTWPADHELLLPYIQKSRENVRYIIAPHEISEKGLVELEKQLNGCSRRFSKLQEDDLERAKVILVDSIGLLSSIYQYGTIGYVGGGFGKGVHNTLEPAVFGLPLFFGPRYKKFDEACQMVEQTVATPVNSIRDLAKGLDRLVYNKDLLAEKSLQTSSFVKQRRGATRIIIKGIEIQLLEGK